MTRDERHKDLEFICDCKACLPGLFQKLSDMQRTLIRGLNFFLTGTDPIGARLKSTSPIIFDPELRKEAEEFYTPLSARFLYNVLMMYLLEVEGLMDHFVFEGCNPTILKLSTLFRTESNDKIAMIGSERRQAARVAADLPHLGFLISYLLISSLKLKVETTYVADTSS
jgi:hypothetical protein